MGVAIERDLANGTFPDVFSGKRSFSPSEILYLQSLISLEPGSPDAEQIKLLAIDTLAEYQKKGSTNIRPGEIFYLGNSSH
ncbi:MAG: hypothetical protein UU81_C0004G0022 [Microgenomates group bacterium GW2011_GWC1_41_8]|uniref:Uncharacterized protein n=3 Tax=Candidatus Roizmaniibacteriota TaxID=1752723 RepID=A0A0G1A625_9BACT|nr:MAG: hypothetical protein UU14_C0017G0022 [Candidatus Roizmanbacteria bacterium GW2011_GWB1_40_7]KKR91812.1 MAG: hypothetical protein UU41_C0032G0002 [Candidatus Roizmanbacteria bacterium GW2011_GWA1_41_13]KKS20758.1 MAG: hypothetical protein UU78_C0053G0002 [Candidatus Roizmanbacteria bacterium GW2011_GWC2_41_7]KKS24625.1 MAG: hypothetical protein UU81_C0004G0022 [Microgenomates group bacterium GW2011_GWC1_41_8]